MPSVNDLVKRLFESSSIAPAAHKTRLQTRLGAVDSVFSYPDQMLESVPEANAGFEFSGTLAPYTGPWTKLEAAHLIRRTGFGVKQSELDLLVGMNAQSAVDALLDIGSIAPPPPINNYNGPDFTDAVVPSGATWINAPFDNPAESYRIESWRGWWYQLMLDQQASIRERMTLFLHNHFVTQTEIVFHGRMVYQMNALLRANALGNFKDLVKKVTLNPMMLVYLNGYLNSKDAPDENFARELQELFTIGKDNPDHYTEDDVIAAARILTGWKIDWDMVSTYPYPLEHDETDKQFSAFYGNKIIAGSLNMEAELDDLLDMIFEKNEVAEYLCRKLYRWFVYYRIDAQTEQNIIKPLAAIFRANNYELKPVVEALLKSDHFFEAAQSGCYIKTPIDITIGNLRTFNVTIPGTTLYDNFSMKYYLTYFLSEMKMIPGDPPGVAGWQAYRQVPLYYRIWINGDTIRNRNLFTDIMAAYYLETDNDRLFIDLPGFVGQWSDAGDPVALIENVTTLLFPKPLSANKKFVLKSILLSGLADDSYWTAAWTDFQMNPTDPMAFEVVNSRLLTLHVYMMRLPEFQLA
jgi:uncharacterized protein (DUF1800 family)